MGKKKNQSLTERISALINRVGEKPEPTFADIKSTLVDCLGIAETLEDGAAVREAEAKITALEAAREESNAELGQLKGELKSANAEIKRFRAEQKKRREKEREIPEIQFQILELLPSESGGEWLNIAQIAHASNIPVDEAEIHIERLRRLGHVTSRSHETHGTRWHRSMPGNELVLAKRLAGEAKQDKKQYYYANLPQTEHDALVVIAAGRGEGASEMEIAKKLRTTIGRTRLALFVLGGKDFAGQHPADPAENWYLRTTGAFYLGERGDLL